MAYIENNKETCKIVNKDIQIPSKLNKIYYTLPLLDYMFRLLRVIIRPSSELIQNYLFKASLNLFLSSDKSLIAFCTVMYILGVQFFLALGRNE